MPRKSITPKPRPKNAKLTKLIQAQNTAPDDDLILYDLEEDPEVEEVEEVKPVDDLSQLKKELESLKKQVEEDRKAREERKKQLAEIKAMKEIAKENRKKEKEAEKSAEKAAKLAADEEHKKYLESLLLKSKKEAVDHVNQQWKSQLTSARINNLKF